MIKLKETADRGRADVQLIPNLNVCSTTGSLLYSYYSPTVTQIPCNLTVMTRLQGVTAPSKEAHMVKPQRDMDTTTQIEIHCVH